LLTSDLDVRHAGFPYRVPVPRYGVGTHDETLPAGFLRPISMYSLGLTILAVAIGWNARAQDQRREKVARALATGTGLKAEFLEEIAYYEQRYVRLAESVPLKKYAWRPVEGVRSIGRCTRTG
jgi:hypothetical protein